jgi:carbamoyl-phosphate synthase small subunit
MKIVLESGQEFHWKSFWADTELFWEVVFTTWVTGYDQTITDPSFFWQIIVFTQPLIWNYWIFWDEKDEFWLLENFESKKIWAKWVIVSEYSEKYSHHKAIKSLWKFLKEQWIPAITWIDTRELTKILRDNWSTLWWILKDENSLTEKIKNPSDENIAWKCWIEKEEIYEPKNFNWKIVLVYDFWIKNNILREFLKRWVKVLRVPFNADITKYKFDWLFLWNWPWNPEKMFPFMEKNIKFALDKKIKTFWICLGHQLIGLAIWAKIEKMKFWHRWVNQPCQDLTTWKCFITSQNHWYEIVSNSLPKDFSVYFENKNDNTCEWIMSKDWIIKSVQFHPESFPGPEDTSFLFDDFIKSL